MKHRLGNLCHTLALLLFTGTPGIVAQNVTIDMEPAPVQYYRMPDRPLDPAFKWYSTEITAYGGNLIRSGVTTSSLERDYMTLEGYQRAGEHADVHIEATVSDFTVLAERRESRDRKSKDKDGETVVTKVYWVEVKYALPVTITVTDRNGRVLDDGFIFTLTDQRTYNTPEERSHAEMENYWRINRTRKLNELHKDMLIEAFRKISDRINYNFGYRRITNENIRFATIGKKKHPDYGKFRTAYETLKHGFELMHPEKSLQSVKDAIKPALDFYQRQQEMYSEKNKDDERLKFMCLYNLALAYLWVEDFDSAKKYAMLSQHSDEKERDIRRLLEEIDSVQASLSRAKKDSRHFTNGARS